MKRIGIVYWSGTGNTEAMARAVAEGAGAAGAETTLLKVSEVKAEALGGFDAVALGCPAEEQLASCRELGAALAS